MSFGGASEGLFDASFDAPFDPPRRVSFSRASEGFFKVRALERLFREAWKAQTLGGCCLEKQMVSFGTISGPAEGVV